MDNENIYIQWNSEQLSLNSYSVVVKDTKRAVFEASVGSSVEEFKVNMDTKDELFTKFFAGAVTSANDMTMEQLVSWIDELQEMVFKAKATLQGAEHVKKNRVAKLRADERDKVKTQDSTFAVSDAINAVSKRKDRMSKTDKLIENMRAMGISEDDIKAVTGTIAVDESKQAIKNNLFSFNRPDRTEPVTPETVETPTQATGTSDSKPFDPSSLFAK